MPLPDVRCLKCEFEARPAVKIMRNLLGGRNRDCMVLASASEGVHPYSYHNASSARIDRWLVSDSLLSNVSAASVTDLILSDH